MVQEVIKVVNSEYGHTYDALLRKPEGYDTNTTEKYPLLVELHGKGEATSTLSSIYANQNAGMAAYYIEQKRFPNNKLIVLTPQAAGSGWSASPSNLDFIIKDMVKRYRIDTNRIYLTGLSAGADTIVKYITGDYSFTPAAVVPMSQAGGEISLATGKLIADRNIHVWGLVGKNDSLFPATKVLVDRVNAAKPGMAISTYYDDGHSGWGVRYDPAFMQGGLNIYDWMLQYSQSDTVASQPPTIPVPTKTIIQTIILYSDKTYEIKPA